MGPKKLKCLKCDAIVSTTYGGHKATSQASALEESAKECEGCQTLWLAISKFIPDLTAPRGGQRQIKLRYFRIEQDDLLKVIIHDILSDEAIALEFYTLSGKFMQRCSENS